MLAQTDKGDQVSMAYKSFEIMLDHCLRTTPKDEILVVHDESLSPFLAEFLKIVADRCLVCTFLAFPRSYQLDLVGRIKAPDKFVHLSRSVFQSITEASVILNVLHGEMDTGPFRGAILDRVRQKGARLAHIPGFDSEILRIIAATPIDTVVKDCEAVAWALGECHQAELRTFDSRGAEHILRLELLGWDNEPMMSPGVFEPDTWGNLPPGETFCCPPSASVNGEVCINGSVPNAPLHCGQEVILVFREGRLVEHIGAPNSPGVLFLEAEKLRANESGDTNWNMFAELGIGLNPAVVTLMGNSLVDEKAIRTVHVALGDNVCFGHDILAAIHADLVTVEPTLICDGELLLNRGQLDHEGLTKRRRILPDYSAKLPLTGKMDLRGGTHEVRDGRLLRRLTSAKRVGYVEMADDQTGRRLNRVCELLKAETDLTSFLKIHSSVDGVRSALLLGLLYHYRILRITSGSRFVP
jgi:hypothetical protein